MMQRNSLSQIFLIRIILAAGIPSVVLSFLWISNESASFSEDTQSLRAAAINSRKEMSRNIVGQITGFMDKNHKGTVEAGEPLSKAEAMEFLGNFRPEDGTLDYFVFHFQDGRLGEAAHPALSGSRILNLKKESARRDLNHRLEGLDLEKGVSLEYSWKDDNDQIKTSILYLELIKEQDLLIGAGVLLDRLETFVNSSRQRMEARRTRHSLFALGLGLLLIIAGILTARIIARRIDKSMNSISSFFEKAVHSPDYLNPDSFYFREITALANDANQMIARRNQAEKAVRESEARFRGLLESAPDAIVIVNPEGKIVMANDRALEMFGFSRAELTQLLVEDLLPQRFRATHRQLRQSYHARPTVRMMGQNRDLFGQNKAGTEFPVEVALSPFETGDGILVSAAIRDISSRKLVEEALLHARDEAERANRAKSDFLSHMSHELRTPLNGVLGYVQLLLRDPQMNNRQLESLQAIQNCGRHLLSLINDVLDLSTIESGGLELHQSTCNLERLLKGVCDILRQSALDRGLELRLEVCPDMPQLIHTDQGKLRQILINLTGNGIKFTERGFVRLTADLLGDGRLQIKVDDSGIGIPEEDQDAIFNPFRQVEFSRHLGGSGLGLAISRRLAIAIGGSLEVTSIQGQGSCFTLTIPLTEVSGEQVEAVQSLDHGTYVLESQEKITILVADDNLTNRDILVRLVRAVGFLALEAEDGAQALDLARQFSPDLVLMDVRMPVMSGLDAVKAMREDPDLRTTPVIAVSASVFSDARERISEAGFDAFLPKPIRAGELFAMISDMLKVRFISSKTQNINPKGELARAIVNLGTSFRKYLVAQLREAIDLGHIGQMNEIVSQLKQGDEDEQLLAGAIEQRAKAFDFEGLQEIVDQLAAFQT